MSFAEPHIADRRVLVIGTRAWMREAGFIRRLKKPAGSLRTIEPYEFLQRKPGRRFDAVVFYEDMVAYDGIRSIERAADYLTEGGRIVGEIFTPDTLDEATVAWLVDRINKRWRDSTSHRDFRLQWELENESRLTLSTESVWAALAERFDELASDPLPGLHLGDVLDLDDLDPKVNALVDEIFEGEEQALARGEISPVAFRYAGRRR